MSAEEARTRNTDPSGVISSGTRPMTPAELLGRLDELGIRHRTIHHQAVYTVAEAKRIRGELPGAHVKNLFLRNKKGRMWLLTCLEDRKIDLKRLGRLLGAGGLSFASPQRLMRYLGVVPGAVTPFAAINDREHAAVVVIDRALLAIDPLNFHPLDNAMTTAIAPGDLLSFLQEVGHPPTVVDLDRTDYGLGPCSPANPPRPGDERRP